VRHDPTHQLLESALELMQRLGMALPVVCRIERRQLELAVQAMRQGAAHVLAHDDWSEDSWKNTHEAIQQAHQAAIQAKLQAELQATVKAATASSAYKKSNASPGVGNYLTMAKAAAATQAVLGANSLKHHSFVQAHGTGTPQNRTTESAIFADVARHFGIHNWPVTAMKSYLGHSIACAGGDQLAMTLGVWKHGIIPGILTTHELASDVTTNNLDFLLQHRQIDPAKLDAALLNSKGFGGNNATASILSPNVTTRMLTMKHGAKALAAWQHRNEAVSASSASYEQRTLQQQIAPLYRYDHDVKDGNDLGFNGNKLSLRGYQQPVDLDLPNPYPDMV
jgi:acetoacetyl-[acyl-carrier protein] synthase